MCRKVLTVLLIGVSYLLSSCVDKRYDLVNKEITTDVKIEDNTIALPIGDLKAIVLDSLIDLDKIEVLDKNDKGIYSICMDSTISVKEGVDPITLNIDPIQHKVDIDFEKVNISDVHIDAVNVDPAKFETPEISLAKLNEGLPKLEDANVRIDFESDGFAELLAIIKELPESMRKISFDQDVSTGERTVPCNIDYTLPEQIETIYGIKLGSVKDPNGVLVNVVVNNPGVLEGINKKINFEIEFPEIFRLARNNAADQVDRYQISKDGNAITVNDFEAKDEVSSFSFYITDIINIDDKIYDGKLSCYNSVKYKIDYKTSGTLELKEGMKVDDFAFNVNLKSDLSFLDVAGKTKDIKVDFNPIDMKFNADFDDLQHIDMINYVEFDEKASSIKFETHMVKDWLSVFKLKEGYALKISFPEELTISPEHSTYEGKGSEIVYNETEHAFYIYDLGILAETHWSLAPQELTLNIPVTKNPVTGKGECHIPVKASIQFVDPEKNYIDHLVLAGSEMESLVDVLDKLKGEKVAEFKISKSDLRVKDAVVHTEVIHSDLGTKTKFNLNEKVPNEIELIENIGFKEDVEMTLDLEVKGLETLDTDIDIVANIALPSFLKLETIGKSSGVSINNGNLSINTSYNPSLSEPFRVKLLCTGIDFRNEEFNFKGMEPKDSTDGNSYISYDKDIVVEGEASIHGTEFHSTVLENDIAFNVDFIVSDEIVVKTFHGIYNAEIDGVDEKIALDLGDGLDFLKEEGNTITLADPQMEFVLTNPIGIPIDIDLLISGRDKTGALVGEEIAQTISIHPAEYDEVNDVLSPVETKIFLTTDENSQKEGYDNYKVESLTKLLAEIPDSISFKIEPIIKTDVTHHVDISDSIRLEGTYSVLVPLAFEELRICYRDTIDGLQNSIGEVSDMLSNISLGLKMDIYNTMPLGLKLTMIPLDADNNIIKDIEINDLFIRAGSGGEIIDANGALNGGAAPQNFSFAIKSKSGDISSLDKLAMTIEATSNSTTGSAGLASGQGLKISNLVFEVSGDVEIK